MKYDASLDIKTVCQILNMSYSELANELGVARSTVTRIVNEESYPTELFLESFYSYMYNNTHHNIRINQLKIKYAQDHSKSILFHGAKDSLEGDIDLNHSRTNIDFGSGFYLGESYEQSSSYVFPYKKSSVYIFDTTGLKSLKIKELDVSLEWMIAVSYYRGQLERFKESKYIKNLVKDLEQYDVIIAPIADNNMYEMMNQFARGDITDQQAIHALSASYLGKQHVLKTEKACQSVKIINRLYLCKEERLDIEQERKGNALNSLNNAKKIIEQYRRKGKYVEEILND